MAEYSAKERRDWYKKRKALLPYFLAQVLMSSLIIVGLLYGGYYHCDSIPVPKHDVFGDRLMYYIRWCVFPGVVVLIAAVMAVVSRRSATPAGNPLAGKEHLVAIQKNFLTNTVEQLLVFLMIALVLTTYLDTADMKLLPIFTLLWVTGRILFRIGYSVNPNYRSVGMVTNFGSSFFFVGVIFYLMYTRGFMYRIATEQGGGSGSTSDSKLEL